MMDTIESLEIKIAGVREIIKKQTKLLNNYCTKQAKLVNAKHEKELPSMGWDRLLSMIDDSTIKAGESYDRLHKIGLSPSGYYMDTKQRSIQVAIRKDGSNVDQVYEGILELYPYLIPLYVESLKEKYVILNVAEFNCAEDGVIDLIISRDNWNDVMVHKTYYSITSILIKSSLRNCLNYIKENHYRGY